MNKQGGHTPGPWTAYELGNEDGTWRKWSIVHNGPIAYGGDSGKGSENSRATAQLMAAAPELLAALESVITWAERHKLNLADCIDGKQRECPVIMDARAAIAKARGAV